jgi:hypothetical protein
MLSGCMIWLSVSGEGVVESRSGMSGRWLGGCGMRRQVDVVGGIELVSTRGSSGTGEVYWDGRRC